MLKFLKNIFSIDDNRIDVEIGKMYCLISKKEIDEKPNPFDEETKVIVKVTDIKDGWIQFQLSTEGVFKPENDWLSYHSLRLESFISLYKEQYIAN